MSNKTTMMQHISDELFDNYALQSKAETEYRHQIALEAWYNKI